jgi:hypothetical protein
MDETYIGYRYLSIAARESASATPQKIGFAGFMPPQPSAWKALLQLPV